MKKASVEVYQSLRCQYQLLPANERDHYGIEPMAGELIIWQGRYQNLELPWLRW
nr:hypothetical protein [Nostoc commune]